MSGHFIDLKPRISGVCHQRLVTMVVRNKSPVIGGADFTTHLSRLKETTEGGHQQMGFLFKVMPQWAE